MSPLALLQVLRGPFHFLQPEAEEVRRLAPDLGRILPLPQRIFLDEEAKTPLRGFPVLLSDGLHHLRKSLQAYVLAEEEAQIGIQARRRYDRSGYAEAWEGYREMLVPAIENVTLSSYGRHFPSIFWLHHSLDVAKLLKETPRRVLRRDLEVGRQFGDHIKYRVFDRYLDRVLNTTYEVVSGLAVDTEEAEERLFPRLLTRLRDNVLLFTEDHVSPDLGELASYFNGHLRIDGRDLRRRLQAVETWHRERFQEDAELRSLATHLLGFPGEGEDLTRLLRQPGYLPFLAERQGWNSRQLMDGHLIRVWENLLLKLKEFELIHGLRRLLVPVKRDPKSPGDRLLGKPGPATGSPPGSSVVVLSSATRPLDFLAPWVVDPLVDRFGLIYDLTDFSQIISVLRRSGSDVQDSAFRNMFRFQRRINQLTAACRMQLEKYLGDGAFYSSRRALPVLRAALEIQRHYRQEVDDDFPFDRGMRIAVNYGQYRIIPIGKGSGDSAPRYEFFGHSLVELSRLTTGKASRDIEEIKTLLMTYGYPEQTVYRFFEPLMRKDVDVVSREDEAHTFRAYINRNGSLINEGIVATEAFLSQLCQEAPLSGPRRGERAQRQYAVVDLEPEEELAVGLRRLGPVALKGLEKVPVYEVVDARDLKVRKPLNAPDLWGALQELDGDASGSWPGREPREEGASR